MFIAILQLWLPWKTFQHVIGIQVSPLLLDLWEILGSLQMFTTYNIWYVYIFIYMYYRILDIDIYLQYIYILYAYVAYVYIYIIILLLHTFLAAPLLPSSYFSGPRSKFLVGTSREARIIRKNFGATHFIIGRDMAGTSLERFREAMITY